MDKFDNAMFNEWLYGADTTPRRSVYVGDQTIVSRTGEQLRNLVEAAYMAGYERSRDAASAREES